MTDDALSAALIMKMTSINIM